MARDDLSEIRFPGGQNGGSFHDHNSVEVKCEIYEPQVSASPSVLFDLLLHDEKAARVALSIQLVSVLFSPQAAAAEEQAHADAGHEHVGQQHNNHTHLHPHEHLHSATPTAVSGARSPLGTVVNQPAPVRSAPAASSCPSPHRHNIGINLGRL